MSRRVRKPLARIPWQPGPPQARCPAMGKRGYLGRVEALAANRKNPKKQRPYKCPHCHMWHTTTTKSTDDQERS